MTNRWMIVVVGCAAIAVAGCDEKLSSIAGPSPNLEPTFASIQRDIFEASDSAGRVACTTCHTNTGRAPSSGMNLNHDVAYDQLVNARANEKPGAMRVIPGDPENSYLLQKLKGTSGITGRRMPFTPPYLQDGQILIIQRWIAIGAPRHRPHRPR